MLITNILETSDKEKSMEEVITISKSIAISFYLTGIVEYKNGERYEGDFENDLRNGKGEYAYLDGSHYSGEFRNDQKEGKGTLKMLNSKTLYEGYFLSGQYHGEGKYTFNELKIEKT